VPSWKRINTTGKGDHNQILKHESEIGYSKQFSGAKVYCFKNQILVHCSD